MSFFHGFSLVQKLAGFGLGMAGLAGLGAVGNQYLGTTTKLPPTKSSFVAEPRNSSTDGRNSFVQKSSSSERTKFRPAFGSININTATAQELDALPGVGPAIAQRIIEFRKQRGGFRSIDELDQVKGIGPKKLQDMRQYCRL